MKTRSQVKEELRLRTFNPPTSMSEQGVNTNEFIFDFDDSSKAWLQNKIKLANGCYRYIPEKNSINSKSTSCKRNK
jgi:hypothetical protein